MTSEFHSVKSYSSSEERKSSSPSPKRVIENTSQKQEIIPTLFNWIGPAENVFLTGSFCNWKQKIRMVQTGECFQVIINLPKGIYQYKYIVDEEWKISKYHKVIIENGIVNNIIDTRKLVPYPKYPKTLNKGKEIHEYNVTDLTSPESCPNLYSSKPNLSPFRDQTFQIPLINHLCYKSSSNFNCFSVTLRVRLKTVNMLYVKPNQSKCVNLKMIRMAQ